MHDFHLADTILKTVLEYAQKNGFKNIKKIELELGSILEHGEVILPENLVFNFKMLSKNTIAQNAELEIKQTKGDSWKLISIEEQCR
jgi:hydrogenase nickel incorporation protein HypA/HybF